MRRIATFAIALACIASLGVAHAQRTDLTPREKKRARQAAVGANRALAAGDRFTRRGRTQRAMAAYRKAAIGYLEAYSITEHPFLLFKLAGVYRARGEKRWALRGYRRYLEVDPEGQGAERALAAVDELTAAIAEDEEAGIEGPEDPDSDLEPSAVFGFAEPIEPEPPPPEPEPVDPQSVTPEPEDHATKHEKKKKKKDEPAKPGAALRWSGIGTAGAGVVFLTVGIVFGADARSTADALSGNDDGWTDEDRKRIADGNASERKMLAFTLVGAAAVVGGGVLWWLGHQAGKEEAGDVAVAPALSPSSFGVAVSGRF